MLFVPKNNSQSVRKKLILNQENLDYTDGYK